MRQPLGNTSRDRGDAGKLAGAQQLNLSMRHREKSFVFQCLTMFHSDYLSASY